MTDEYTAALAQVDQSKARADEFLDGLLRNVRESQRSLGHSDIEAWTRSSIAFARFPRVNEDGVLVLAGALAAALIRLVKTEEREETP